MPEEVVVVKPAAKQAANLVTGDTRAEFMAKKLDIAAPAEAKKDDKPAEKKTEAPAAEPEKKPEGAPADPDIALDQGAGIPVVDLDEITRDDAADAWQPERSCPQPDVQPGAQLQRVRQFHLQGQ